VKKDLLSTPPKQRVIISTNILESGITLDYLDVVVDPGYELTAKFNPFLNSNVITMFDLAPKDKIIQ
jgi:HrpA-like RNA helicase